MTRYSRTGLVRALKNYSKQLNRTPMQDEVAYNKKLPPINQFYLVFGSWNNALKAAKKKIHTMSGVSLT